MTENRGKPPTRAASRNRAMTKITLERLRQIEIWGEDDYPEFVPERRLQVLVEEVGEVARALENSDDSNLYEELTQVAATALRWLEQLGLEMDR